MSILGTAYCCIGVMNGLDCARHLIRASDAIAETRAKICREQNISPSTALALQCAASTAIVTAAVVLWPVSVTIEVREKYNYIRGWVRFFSDIADAADHIEERQAQPVMN